MTPASCRTRLRRRMLLAVATFLPLLGCAAREGAAPPPSVAAPPPPVARVAEPPEWRPGDQWSYGWSAGAENGTKVVEILALREINSVPFYLVRVGELDHFYTRDLSWAGTMRDAKVESRMVPPQPWFAWPLEVGRRWTHQGTFEVGQGKSSVNNSFAVLGAETIDVPAGRFQTLKVVREGTARDTDEYWFAPEVRFYVKWVGRRGDSQFEEQLREYRPAPRLIPPASPSDRK